MFIRAANENDAEFLYDFDIEQSEQTYVIQTQGMRVGVLEGSWSSGILYLDYIEIHSDCRGQGFGSRVVNQLLEEGVRIEGNAVPDSVPFWRSVGVDFYEDEDYMRLAAEQNFAIPFVLEG